MNNAQVAAADRMTGASSLVCRAFVQEIRQPVPVMAVVMFERSFWQKIAGGVRQTSWQVQQEQEKRWRTRWRLSNSGSTAGA